MKTTSANSERERLIDFLDACATQAKGSSLILKVECAAIRDMLRADASLRSSLSRKDEEIEGLRAAFTSCLRDLGAALVDVLQGDYTTIEHMARGYKIVFPDGEPMVYSPTLDAQAEGRQEGNNE